MTLRKKMTILLLTFSVVPAITIAVVFHLSLQHVAAKISSDLESVLNEQAESTLQAQMVNFTGKNQILKKLIDETLFLQAEALLRSCERKDIPLPQSQSDAKVQNYFFPAELTQTEKARSECILNYLVKTYELADVGDGKILRRITIIKNGSAAVYPYDPALESISELNFTNKGWYKNTIESEQIQFAEPGGDFFTDQPVILFAQPVKDNSGKTIGVTALEMPISTIFEGFDVNPIWTNNSQKAIIAIRYNEQLKKDQLLAIISNQQDYSPKGWQNLATIEEAFGIEQQVCESIHDDIKKGKSGIRRADHKGKDSLWIYHPANKKDSAALLIIPYENIIAAADKVRDEIFQKNTQSLSITAITVAIAVLAAVFMAIYRAKTVTHPVKQIADAGIKLRNGNFDIQVDINTGDELQELGEVFNQIGPHLKERQTMLHSLELAQTIQKNLLPTACPDIPGYEIAGLCSYCDETGGDYFDYVAANDDSGRILLALGDVTGHGIPAALLMVSARSLIRSLTSYCCSDLASLLTSFNKHFLSDTDGMRFMTMFMCLLNPDNSDVYWTAGGHDPAIIYQPVTDSFIKLENTGMLLGVIEEAEYHTGGPVSLNSGDVMLIGTDGIWEAHNDYGEMYGKGRLYEAIKKYKDLPAQEIANNILNDVETFYDNHPRMDDITMIVVKRL